MWLCIFLYSDVFSSFSRFGQRPVRAVESEAGLMALHAQWKQHPFHFRPDSETPPE